MIILTLNNFFIQAYKEGRSLDKNAFGLFG